MTHEHAIHKLTAIWLLPIVAPVFVSGTGAALCSAIPDNSYALQATLAVSYALWRMGIPFAFEYSRIIHPPTRNSQGIALHTHSATIHLILLSSRRSRSLLVRFYQ